MEPREQGGADFDLAHGRVWGCGVPLEELSLSALHDCPARMPDGRHLFFTSRWRIVSSDRSAETHAALRARLARRGSGEDEHCWAAAPEKMAPDRGTKSTPTLRCSPIKGM